MSLLLVCVYKSYLMKSINHEGYKFNTCNQLKLMHREDKHLQMHHLIHQTKQSYTKKEKREKIMLVTRYEHECEPVYLMMIMVFHDAT